MARKQKNNVDYFPHFCTHGKKMHIIRNRYGNDGYVVWFMLLEHLALAEYHFLDLEDDIQKMYLSDSLKVSEETLFEIIELLVKLNEFDADFWNNKILFSEKFVDSVEDAYRRRSNNIAKKTDVIQHLVSIGRSFKVLCRSNAVRNTQSKVKNSKVDKSKVERTPSDSNKVRDYFIELGLQEHQAEHEGLKFWNHFQSNGWKVGGRAAMKDWKSAAQNWKTRIKDWPKPKEALTYDEKILESFLNDD